MSNSILSNRLIIIHILFLCLFVLTCYAEKINIIYTANINATLENCNCGSQSLGGLDRIKSFINDYKTNDANTVFIDGGNYFNSYPYTELNETMLLLIPVLDFNIMSPGYYCFLEQKPFVDKYLKNTKDKIISTNSNLSETIHRTVKINQVNLQFYNFIDSRIFKYSKKPDWLNLNEDIKVNSNNRDIFILIYHGFVDDAIEFIKKHNNFDLILLSYDQQKNIWKIDETTIVGCGSDAEYIAIIEITKNKYKTEINTDFKAVDNTIEPDIKVTEMIRSFKLLSEERKGWEDSNE